MALGNRTPLSVAPLSALDLPVNEYVQAAANAGFNAVGLRVSPVSSTDPHFPLDVSSTEFRHLESVLKNTDIEVLDLEVFTITPETNRGSWMPLLEVGAQLGARYLNVIGDHPSYDVFKELVMDLTEDAQEHDIVPVLEPVAYRHMNNFQQATTIARDTGCAVEIDILHFLRTRTHIDTVRSNRDLFPILQLCDAPASLNTHGDLLEKIAISAGEENLEIAESRELRLLPGQGDGPIRELLSVLGPSTQISVEIPNVTIRGDKSAEWYLELLYKTAQTYLAANS